MVRPLSLLMFLSLVSPARPDSAMSGPAEVKTTAEILASAKQDGFRSGMHVASAEFRGRSRSAFVAWYNPYSGEAACHVYIYVQDAKNGTWVRKLARIFDDTSDVSVEFGGAIVIRDVKGKVVHRQPVE